MPNVTIDGKTVKVEVGQTILDAACKAGVWIPTLCHHPSVSSSASCRICMVELDRGDLKQLVTACNYPVRADIVVNVSGDTATSARHGVMELLLARAPDSEELKELSVKMGVAGTRYPKVTESQRNCVLCGLCTSVCEQVIGKAAIAFAGRGVDRSVATPFREPSEDCIGCGACAAVCPVGTIQVRLHPDTEEVEISPFKTRTKMLLCKSCGTRLVAGPLAKELQKKVKMDWAEFRERAKLCPACRRRKAAESLASGGKGKTDFN
ncbi:MAG: (2Fe-2S)-binding protein [Lentisphaerae bacterium]|nr:(2Fe-2S)-binding protein [Lentisphaerota bacterium]